MGLSTNIIKQLKYFKLNMEKYLHCGKCWGIIGFIPKSAPERDFDTYDCSWSCKCGRLNLSSDGVRTIQDFQGDEHSIYFLGEQEASLINEIPDRFDIRKFQLPFTNPYWKGKIPDYL